MFQARFFSRHHLLTNYKLPRTLVLFNIKCEGRGRARSNRCFVPSQQPSGGEKKSVPRKRTDLKIAPGPVRSKGVTVGKTHQGDHAVPLGFAHTHSPCRSGGGGQVCVLR